MIEMIVLLERLCPVCNMTLPILEEIAEDYAGKLTSKMLDTEKNPELLKQYSAEVVPTILLFVQGKEVGRMSGMLSEKLLRERLEALLLEKKS